MAQRYYTDTAVNAVPELAGASQAEVQQRVDDASALYAYLTQNEGTDDDALAAWVTGLGRTLDDLAAAMALLVSWGKVYPVEGSAVLPAVAQPGGLEAAG